MEKYLEPFYYQFLFMVVSNDDVHRWKDSSEESSVYEVCTKRPEVLQCPTADQFGLNPYNVRRYIEEMANTKKRAAKELWDNEPMIAFGTRFCTISNIIILVLFGIIALLINSIENELLEGWLQILNVVFFFFISAFWQVESTNYLANKYIKEIRDPKVEKYLNTVVAFVSYLNQLDENGIKPE